MDGLNPCPWENNDCSDGHIPRVERANDILGKPLFFVDCSCGARCSIELTENQAIEAWNNTTLKHLCKIEGINL